MSVMTHGCERPLDRRPRLAALSRARKAHLKRAAFRILAVLSMGSVLAAFIAAKTAIYVWRLHA